MDKRPYLNLIIFFTAFLWATSFPKAVLNPYFLESGLNFNSLLFGLVVLFAAQIVILLVLRNLSSRIAWRLAIILFMLSILSIVKMGSILQYLLFSAISGFTMAFFWVFYNIAHFKLTPKEKTGKSSALMFSIGPLISIVVPLAAGFLTLINTNLVWVFTILFAIVSLLLVNFQTDFRIKYGIHQSLKAIERVRIFIFLEGIWEAVVLAIIPIYTLFFIRTPIGYGVFLSYLGVVSVIANLVLGHISDKKQRRVVFLYPVTIAMSIATFLLVYGQENLIIWLVLTGIITFFGPMFWNLTTALFIDNQNDLEQSFPGRELLLAVGRAIGIGLTLFAFLVAKQNLLYVFLGFIMLIFSAILFYRTRISKKFSYL